MFLPDSKDSAEIIHDIVELHLQVFQDVAGLHTQLKYRCEKCWNDTDNKYTHSLENKNHSHLSLPWLQTSSPAGPSTAGCC